MKYFAPMGKPLTKKQWEEAYLAPNYTHIRSTKLAEDVSVETSWVGVAAEWEKVPKIYVTLLRTQDAALAKKAKKYFKEGEWTSSLIQAGTAHDRAVREVKSWL